MTSPDDIKLRKVGEPEPNSLPRGVYAIVLDKQVVFMRREFGRFVQLSPEEQNELRKRHVIS